MRREGILDLQQRSSTRMPLLAFVVSWNSRKPPNVVSVDDGTGVVTAPPGGICAGTGRVAATAWGIHPEGAAGHGEGSAVLRTVGAPIPDATGFGRVVGRPGATIL